MILFLLLLGITFYASNYYLMIWLFFLLNVFTGMYQIREANQMVEEFMLAANVSVAEQILRQFPLCSLLRYTDVFSFIFAE